MSAPSAPPTFPPLDEAGVRAGAAVLRQPSVLMAADPDVEIGELEGMLAGFVGAQSTTAVQQALALWSRLAGQLLTPEHAARLPQAPYVGPGTPWLVSGLLGLPAMVVLAGDDALLGVLAGTVDPLALPDPGLRSAESVITIVGLLGGKYAVGQARREKEQSAIYDQVVAAPVRYAMRPEVWHGVDVLEDPDSAIDGPGVVVEQIPDRQTQAWTSVSSPLGITDRYPSELKGGNSKLAGGATKRGTRAAALRALWAGALHAVVEEAIALLVLDVQGRPLAAEQALFDVAPHRLSSTPVRGITLALTSGLKLGGMRGGRAPLPVPGVALVAGPLPPEADVETTWQQEMLRVEVGLPAKALPTLEDTAAALARLLAHQILEHVPDLTPHAYGALTRWRDHGPAGSQHVAEFCAVVDRAVRVMTDQGVELEARPTPA